jgi:YYY domain-containing protein
MIPTLLWWLVIQLFALAALPLTWRWLAHLPSRGYPLAKAIGLLLVSFLLWLAAIFHLLPNRVGGVVAALVIVAGVSAWAGRGGLIRQPLAAPSAQGDRPHDRDAAAGLAPAGGTGRPLFAWLRANWRLVLATELLFLFVLVAWAAFRAYNPDIAGTEKPMEFAFINGVLGSRFFPPQDPWLSGYAISYYYFGYVMLGILIQLTGVDPAIGFNLGVALWYALAMIGAFGIVYDLVRLAEAKGPKVETLAPQNTIRTTEYAIRSTPASGRGIAFGILGAVFVGVLANLEVLVEFAYHRGLAPLSWIEWLDIKQLTDAPPTGGWTGGFWWWWRASRVIHDRDLFGATIEVIDEFPFFSFLLGDMHPHVLALPFVLLAIGLALNLLLHASRSTPDASRSTPDASRSTPDVSRLTFDVSRFTLHASRFLDALTGLGLPGIVLSAVTLGALAFLNTWDFPIYLALATLALGVGLARQNGLQRAVVGRALAGGALLGVLGVLFYLPFYVGFQSQLGGVLPNLLFPSRFSQYLVMFGPLLVLAIFFLALVSWSPVGKRGTGSLLRRGLAVLPWTLIGPAALLALLFGSLLLLPQGRAFLDTVLDNPAVRAHVGDRSAGELAALILRVRVQNPWTYLALAGLIAWAVGLIWARLEEGGGRRPNSTEAGGGTGEAPPIYQSTVLPITDLFALLLIGLALLLTFAVEFVYLRDLFGSRMNTVFKLYYQAWVMLALAAAYAVSRLAAREVALGFKLPALTLAGLLVFGGLLYPLAAIPSKADGFQGQPTLDGLAHLRRYNPADMLAIEWLRANVAADAVVVEAPGGSYSPEGAQRVSMSTGNPTLLGWDFHERQWRGAAYDRLTAGRPEALDQIYRGARAEDLPKLLDKWAVDYVYVGALERRKYGLSDPALARFDRSLRRVYDRDGVRIYAR